MTSNERKILECIWNHGGEADIRLISDKTGLSSDYSHFLCRALKSAGHLELSGHAFCRLSEKGHKYFQDRDSIGVVAVSFLPQEESAGDPALSSILSEENVSRNDIKHEEEATEKPIVNPIDKLGSGIKRFVELLKGSIKVPESGNAAQGTRHQ